MTRKNPYEQKVPGWFFLILGMIVLMFWLASSYAKNRQDIAFTQTAVAATQQTTAATETEYARTYVPYTGTATPPHFDIEANAVCHNGSILPHLVYSVPTPHTPIWTILVEGPGGPATTLEYNGQDSGIQNEDAVYPAEIPSGKLISLKPGDVYVALVIEATGDFIYPNAPTTYTTTMLVLETSNAFETPVTC